MHLDIETNELLALLETARKALDSISIAVEPVAPEGGDILAKLIRGLEAVSHTIELAATDEGILDKPISRTEIATFLNSKLVGIPAITSRDIMEPPMIRELGPFSIKIYLTDTRHADIKLWVVPLPSHAQRLNAS